MSKRMVTMTEGSIEKRVIQFAVPILLSNLLQQMYNTLDTIVVGRFVGSTALAAVGSTTALVNLVIGFYIGLSTGAGVVVAQYYGAKNEEQLHKSVHTGMAISLASAVIIAVVGVVGAPHFLRWMGTPEDVMALAVSYLRIMFGGVIFMTLYNMGSGILRAIGDSTRPLIYLAVCAVLNVGLNLIFVIVFEMGVNGVAWATIIAQSISAALVLYNLIHTKEMYQLHPSKIRFHKDVFLRIVNIGIPAGIQSMVVSFSNVVVQSNVNSFGSVTMAAFAASGKIDAFIYMVANALGLTATTFVGQNVGAKQYERVRTGVKQIVVLAMGSVAIFGGVVAIFAPQLVGLVNSEPDVIAIGAVQLRYLALTYWLLAIPEVLSGSIRGSGISLVPMIISMVGMCGFRLVWLAIIMPIFRDFRVVSVCYVVSWVLTAATYLIYVKKSGWMYRFDPENRGKKLTAES
ncbi:MAG: MATE family efflux transporter [Firmicutes bacterium]|nr:MATE family efflux transporter [Bacillota bacterium]